MCLIVQVLWVFLIDDNDVFVVIVKFGCGGKVCEFCVDDDDISFYGVGFVVRV